MLILALLACDTPESFGLWYAEEVCAVVVECARESGGTTEKGACVPANADKYAACEHIDQGLAAECRELVEGLTCDGYMAGDVGAYSPCDETQLCR